GDLEVVARLVAERGTDESLERTRIARRSTCGRGPQLVGGQPCRDAPEVRPRHRRAPRGRAVPQLAGDVGETDERPFGQSAGEPRDAGEEAGPGPLPERPPIV